VHLSIDWQGAETIYLTEPALSESPEVLYARAWAVSLMEEALCQLTALYDRDGRGALCKVLLPALESPLPDTTFAEAAAGLGLTAGALRSAAVRMRQRYRRILLALAAERLGVTCEAALSEELRVLLTGKR
jgi:RNA polymerase sigma-70 factor (ECF subfamily)